jgi:hypothetical protein
MSGEEPFDIAKSAVIGIHPSVQYYSNVDLAISKIHVNVDLAISKIHVDVDLAISKRHVDGLKRQTLTLMPLRQEISARIHLVTNITITINVSWGRRIFEANDPVL